MATKQKTKVRVKVVENKDEPIGTEVIAQAIIEMSAAMKKINGGRLKREAIVTLLKDQTKVDKNKIEAVLDGLDKLEETWTRKLARQK